MIEQTDSQTIKIIFISDFQRIQEKAEGLALAGERRDILINSCKRAGVTSDTYLIVSIDKDFELLRSTIRKYKPEILVPLGNLALEFITGLKSIDKWHCSILKPKAEYDVKWVVPLFHPEYVQKVYSETAYVTFGCMRIKKILSDPNFKIPERKYVIFPTLAETRNYIYKILRSNSRIAVDLETSRGQINTVGFAITPTEGIAIPTLPDSMTTEEHYELWTLIRAVCESSIPKVCQNGIYETLFLSAYGIKLNNIYHDTQIAMKFLHPEFEKGLHNVGRIYTPYPYWKDDNENWNSISNWEEHYKYNIKDTTGTLWASYEQEIALKERKLDKLFYDYQMKILICVQEMCTKGLCIDVDALNKNKTEIFKQATHLQNVINTETLERIGRTINPRSSKQLQAALKEMGMKLPSAKKIKTVDGVKTVDYGESADKKTLIKLRKKYPDEMILPALIELSSKNKQLSNYVDFKYEESTSKIYYTLDPHGTETARMSGYCDPWGRGFNPQTVPKFARKMFIPEKGKLFLQIDLQQAESRYVAYEAPEPTLIRMLNNKEDVHKYVASRIFKKAPEFIVNKERQLGKKSGHAANYGVGPRTFAEACLVENDIVVSEKEAKHIITTYLDTFPGIRRRQENIRTQVSKNKFLRTPTGRERYFYGRTNDSMFREAYAYCPQSVIPDITNHLMLYLRGKCDLVLQVHDSLLLQVRDYKHAMEIYALSVDYDKWHPRIELPGGRLIIPIDAEIGENWKEMDKIT